MTVFYKLTQTKPVNPIAHEQRSYYFQRKKSLC